MPKINSSELVAVDLFAGAGGFSLAAIKAGFTIDFAIENDKHAVQTYRNNILKLTGGQNAAILDRSILDYSPTALKEARFSNKSCDLLLGGPPCQGFSTHRILNAGVNDPRNELVLAYFKFVKALRPRVFLMENVPGILWGRHKEYLEKFYSEGKKAGFHLFQPVTIDARDFGVPQRRKRVFILGLRNKEDLTKIQWPPSPTHCDPAKNNIKLLPWVSCEKMFRDAPVGDENDIHMNHGKELVDVFKKTPLNGGSRADSGRVLNCHKEHDGHKDVYGRIDPFQPAPTMTTACINPSKGRFVHPTKHHGITVRQAARIQNFPDTYIFCGGLTAAGKQIGNAVPVDLGRHLIRHIKKHIFDFTDFREKEKMNRSECESV
ncbi:DNA methyltransferase [Arsukibacterium sp. MJ3]|uniref:DNA cytosine methyltransferase n=1 Tax=Arsukibacterium sp. MJ3 TaxID=1632859 RepID=UPI00062700AF|nr:DNA cytosine methyltransferase [Arsukibacterium sp. MJ3]KKO49439.1 DNA methyltransferase [Arsukibacterium sp. MJ3]